MALCPLSSALRRVPGFGTGLSSHAFLLSSSFEGLEPSLLSSGVFFSDDIVFLSLFFYNHRTRIIWDEVIRDGIDGYVVGTDDIDQTTEKLDLLIKNSSKTKIMGENAAEYISENFSIETEAKKLIDHIKHVQNTKIK